MGVRYFHLKAVFISAFLAAPLAIAGKPGDKPIQPETGAQFAQMFREMQAGPYSPTEDATPRGTSQGITTPRGKPDRSDDFVGREEVVERALNTLVSVSGPSFPLLYGDRRVGKKTIVDILEAKLSSNGLPQAAKFQDLKGRRVIWIGSTPGSLSLDEFAKTESLHKPGSAIFAIQDLKDFSNEELRVVLQNAQTLKFPVIAIAQRGNLPELRKMPSVARMFREIEVPELSVGQVQEVLEKTIAPQLETTYLGAGGKRGSISKEAISDVVRRATELYPEKGRLDAAIQTLQEAMIWKHRNAGTNAPVLERSDLSQFLSQRMPGVIDTADPAKLHGFLEAKREELSHSLIGQKNDVDAMIGLWGEAMQAKNANTVKIMVVAGPTGTGSEGGGKAFAQAVLGTPDRHFEINGAAFGMPGDRYTLFGTPAGHTGSEITGGTLGAFLREKGKGRNVITIVNLDKANPQFIDQLNEALKNGYYLDNRGERVNFGKTLIRIVTHKGAAKIFPPSAGAVLSPSEEAKHLAGMNPSAIRKLLKQPSLEDLYAAQAWPDDLLDRVSAWVVSVPPQLDGAIELARRTFDASAESMKEKNIHLTISDSGIRALVTWAYRRSEGISSIQKAVDRLMSSAEAAMSHGGTGRIEFSVSKESPQFQIVNEKNQNIPLNADLSFAHSQNVLEDPEARARLATLGERIAKRIIGQRQAAMGTQEAIRSNVTDPTNPRPPFMVYLGPTGTGKTEMAVALAEEETGDPGRIDIVDLGATIKNENDIDSFFGVGRQMQGGTSASEFQRILAKGDGVVLFDELGNIGGPPSSKANISAEEARLDAERREKLKQKFLTALYTITDRGTWTAPNGDVYHLKGKRFIITSNEMQEEVMHMPNDEQKLGRWGEINNPQYLKAGLQERGWPQALLGRVGNAIFYFKPLDFEEQVQLTHLMLDKPRNSLAKAHGLGGITVSSQTVRNIAESFYSHTAGGRSIRDLAGTPMSDLLADAVTKLYEEHLDALSDAAAKKEYKEKVQVEITLDDNFQNRFRFAGSTPPDRSVVLRLKLTTPDGEKTFSKDLTQIAPEKPLLSDDDVKRAAYHQAARIITNDPSVTGLRPRFATLKPAGEEVGFVQFQKDKAQARKMTRAEAVNLIANAMVGLEARQKMQDTDFSGLAGDMRQARAIAEKAIRQNMLVSNAQSLRQMVEGGARGEAVAEKEIEQLLADGTLLAQSAVEKHWDKIQALASALINQSSGSINGSEIESILSGKPVCELGKLAESK